MQKPLYINEKFLLQNALLISKSVCCEFILWECKEFLSLSLMWDKKRVFQLHLSCASISSLKNLTYGLYHQGKEEISKYFSASISKFFKTKDFPLIKSSLTSCSHRVEHMLCATIFLGLSILNLTRIVSFDSFLLHTNTLSNPTFHHFSTLNLPICSVHLIWHNGRSIQSLTFTNSEYALFER